MSRIKRLIHEIHRRSIWQVLGIYLIGAWLVYQVIVTLWETLHLPDWVPGVSLILFLIGLPIVLATAFVQEGIGRVDVRGPIDDEPNEAATTPAERAAHRRLLTWRNALAGGVLAFAGLGAVTTGTIVLRSLGLISSPTTDGKPTIDTNAVVVLPFRVSSSPELVYLREGMVDLLAAKLTGEGGPRAVDQRTVLRAWRAAVGNEADDLPHDAALGLARTIGAGMLLLGDVVGTRDHVTLNTTLYRTDSAQPTTRASVAGPMDSIAALIDRLAAELLSRSAGEQLERLATLTTASLPALQAYLAGQTAYRSGHFAAAAVDFRRAVDIDSTFALAGFMLAQAKGWDGFGPDWQRGRELAWAGKDRLNPRDRAMMIAFMGEKFPELTPQRTQLVAWQRLAQQEPKLPEVWYGLGDEYFHRGEWLGFQDALERAEAAFLRALEIDSTYAPPLRHMLDLAAYRGDTAALRRLAGRLFGQAPETRDHGFQALLVARILADSTWLKRVLDRFDAFNHHDAYNALGLARNGHLPYEDGVRAAELIRRRTAAGVPEWQHRRWVPFDFYADAGQPARAREIAQSVARAESNDIAPLFQALTLALFRDGDTAVAAAAATELRKRASREDFEPRHPAWGLTALWHAQNGDVSAAREALHQLRRIPPTSDATDHFFDQLLLATVETRVATVARAPDLQAHALHLDSLLTNGLLANIPTSVGNLVVAEAFAVAGDLQRALAAARRRAPTGTLRPAMLLAEARIATQLADRAAAMRAYQQYLALRPDPEPGRPREQVEAARSELARLLREKS